VSNAIVGGQGDYIGLGKNDVILEVNGVEVLGHSMSEVASMIKGPEGSSGTLLIRRNGSDVEEELSFEREFVDKVRRRPR
jgi:C-terminal processing protease CtpA/Prc